MAVAYWLAHAPQSFFPVQNGGDAAVLFCFVFLYLVFAGPGAFSLDARARLSARRPRQGGRETLSLARDPRGGCRMPEPVSDVREPAAEAALGALPEWDLSDLYAAPDAPEIGRDLGWLEAECAGFAAAYEGKLAGLDAAGLLAAIRRYERIETVSGRLGSYAGLRYYQNTTDPLRAKFFGDMQTGLTDATTPLVFFTLELNRLDDASLDATVASDPALARYKPVLDRIRKMKPHQLSDELEKFLHDQSVVGAAAWNRLYDETLAGLSFEVAGETLSLEATLDLLSDPDRARRQAGAEALAVVFRANLPLFARVTNTLAKEKEIEDRWRKLPNPQAGRHLANDVEPEVVEALRDAVVAAYPRLSHRYYALKAKWLGLDKLQIWDRNAPLPTGDDRKIRLERGAVDGARTPTPASIRGWRSWRRRSSSMAGSTRRSAPARRRAPSRIRRSPRCILTCCSTISASSAT